MVEENKMIKSYLLCALSYFFAIIIGIVIGYSLSFMHPLLIILMADLAGTLTIFIISSITKNSSFYDPYWSVAPLVIAIYYIFLPHSTSINVVRQVIIFVLVCIWSIRLTHNWLRQWRGIKHEDWRYARLRQKHGKNFWFINLTGIHLMPTIIVYLGSLSLFPALSLSSKPIGFLDILAIIITSAAIFLEALADKQLANFINNRKNPHQMIKNGLWAVSRHPNYFGEILFWWGLYLFALSADILAYWVILGPISVTLLFNIVSIPMMEKRNLEKKPEYDNYKKRVSRLVPWFPRD